jgi:serine/threonine protein kinase
MAADQKDGRGAFHYALDLHYGIGIESDLEEAIKYYELAADVGYSADSESAYRCRRAIGQATFSEGLLPEYFPRRALLLSRHELRRPYTVPKRVSQYLSKPRSRDNRLLIGNGGFAAVYLETNEETDQKIVVKEISWAYEETHFIREIETLIKLNHPCVVRILGFNLPPLTESAEIQMEYAENGSLVSVLRSVQYGSRPRFWDPTGIGIIICGIVLGMRYVHSQGFIHQDLKPSNILINEMGYAMIADFGTTRSECDNQSRSGDTGSVQYAAPELYLEDDCFSNKIDVFSFGMILYEILTGSPVFPSHMSPFPIMRTVLKGDMPVIPDCVGPAMQSLIKRCWSLAPGDRPSFDDILNELGQGHFAVFPGASSVKILEYVRSVHDWERCSARSDQGFDNLW